MTLISQVTRTTIPTTRSNSYGTTKCFAEANHTAIGVSRRFGHVTSGLVAWLIAVVLLYFGMSQFGIWESMNSLIFDVGGSQKITFGMVFAICALIGVVVAIFNTILAPLLAVIYNSIVDLFGGLDLGLQDANKSTKSK